MAHTLDVSWDPKKARSNIRKHHIAFTEAVTALDDDFAIVRPDRDFPDRSILIGRSREQNILVVVQIEYIEHNWVRLLSARKANKKEREKYARGDIDE